MTTIEQQNANRIRIVQFLRTELPNERFRLSQLTGNLELLKEEFPNLANFECGTVGCVIGWTPVAHPDQVKFIIVKGYNRTEIISILVRSIDIPDGEHQIWHELARKLYGVPEGIAIYLFNARQNYSCLVEPVPGYACDYNSTPKQVADRIEAYFNAHPLVNEESFSQTTATA